MDNHALKYFYLVHFYTYHNLILQKIIEAAKVFTDNDPDVTICATPQNNGYTVLVVESLQPVPQKTIDQFEVISDNIEGLVQLFSHMTISLEEGNASTYVPSYVFSSYYHLHFSFFSRYFGGGLFFIIRLVKKLRAITGGVYVFKTFKNELLLVLESDTPFIQAEVDDLLKFLNHSKVKPQSSFRNF